MPTSGSKGLLWGKKLQVSTAGTGSVCDGINSSFLHAVWLRPITIFQGFFKLTGVGVGAGGVWEFPRGLNFPRSINEINLFFSSVSRKQKVPKTPGKW